MSIWNNTMAGLESSSERFANSFQASHEAVAEGTAGSAPTISQENQVASVNYRPGDVAKPASKAQWASRTGLSSVMMLRVVHLPILKRMTTNTNPKCRTPIGALATNPITPIKRARIVKKLIRIKKDNKHG